MHKKRLDSAQTQATELQYVFEELSKQHEHLQEQETSARNSLNTLVVKRDQGRSDLDAAREAYTHASAERTALEELERLQNRRTHSWPMFLIRALTLPLIQKCFRM